MKWMKVRLVICKLTMRWYNTRTVRQVHHFRESVVELQM